MALNQVLFLGLRTVHVLSGVFWVGVAFVVTGFVEPTARRLKGEGQRFLQVLMLQSRLRQWIMAAAWTAVLSGIVLYSSDAHYGWVFTPYGVAVTIGGIAAVAALGVGMGVLRVVADRMAELGKEIQRTGRPPSEAQGQQMAALQQKMHWASRVEVVLFIVVLVGMALGA